MLVISKQLFEPHRELIDPKVECHPFHKPRLRQPVSQLRNVRRILKLIDDFKPDVIHFQLGHMWFNLALPILRRKYPIVFTVHDPRHHLGDLGAQKTPQWWMDYGYRQADHLIVHGSQLTDVLVDEVGIARERIHVIPHIAIGERDVEPTEGEQDEVLFFGRIWAYKGLDYFIRAQPLVNREIPNAKFVICGRGEDFERYRGMMQDPARFEVNNRWITDSERSDYFRRASVVVLPYVEASQSGVVPVAYAHFKPVIATKVGGLPDCVDDGVTGLLVPPANETELAQAIIRLLKDGDLRKAMGIAGNQKLKRDLSPIAVCRQTAEVYAQAIEDRKALRASRGRKSSPSHVGT